MPNPTPSELRAQLKAVKDNLDRQFTQYAADSTSARKAMQPTVAAMDGPTYSAWQSTQRVGSAMLSERTKCLLECIRIAQSAVSELEGFTVAAANVIAARDKEIAKYRAMQNLRPVGGRPVHR